MNPVTAINVNYDILAFIHLLVNICIAGISVCRLGKMNKVLKRVKYQYILLTVVAVGNGLSPIFFQQWPTLVSVVFAATILYILIADSYQWTKGAPEGAVTQPAPLE